MTITRKVRGNKQKMLLQKKSNPLCLTCSDSRVFKQWLLQLLPGHWKPTKSRFSCINTSPKSELKDFLSQKLLKKPFQHGTLINRPISVFLVKSMMVKLLIYHTRSFDYCNPTTVFQSNFVQKK